MKPRIAICGGPLTGKTTMARKLAAQLGGLKLQHTDDLIDLGWSESSAAASLWFDEPDVGIVEGVAAVRALRKWLERNPDGKPVDQVHFLIGPWVPQTKGQQGMAKGCQTIMSGIEDELKDRGVAVKYFATDK